MPCLCSAGPEGLAPASCASHACSGVRKWVKARVASEGERMQYGRATVHLPFLGSSASTQMLQRRLCPDAPAHPVNLPASPCPSGQGYFIPRRTQRLPAGFSAVASCSQAHLLSVHQGLLFPAETLQVPSNWRSSIKPRFPRIALLASR